MKEITDLTLERNLVNFSPNLLQAEKEYITDYKSNKLSSYSEKQVYDFCEDLIVKAYTDTGQFKIERKIVDLMSESLFKEIMPFKEKISPFGLKQLMEKGVRKEFGEYYGINSVSFNLFIKSYLSSEERSNAIIKQREHEKKISQERKEIENMDAAKNFTIYCFQTFKEQNTIYDPANVAYDWIKEKGLIKGFTKQLKESIRLEAEQRIRTFKLKGENKGVPASQEILKRIANRNEKKLTFEDEVTALCKHLHLRIIFETLTLEEIEKK